MSCDEILQNLSAVNPWDHAQLESFYEQTKELHKQIVLALGDDFEVVYKQE